VCSARVRQKILHGEDANHLALIRSFFDRFRVLPTPLVPFCAKNFQPVRKSFFGAERTKIFARTCSFAAQRARASGYRARKKSLNYRMNRNVAHMRARCLSHRIVLVVIVARA
jgi:hypothetical protein